MNTTRCSIAFFLLAFAVKTLGSTITVEGHADLNVLLATDTMVVSAKTVSGDEDEVFAVDTQTKTVKWRINAKHVAEPAIVDGINAFYMISDNHLQRRALQTGLLIWSTRLD